ncbi:MAG TPA: carbohydrate kinase family protein [Candidatus Bathyarchaeia archaeon]|nr:carbohydrate kinase family protein [Candidatus Bathyarchaeia archaeon]
MLSWLVNDLLRVLKRARPYEFKVVVMPDFFIDRFVTYQGSSEEFSSAVAEVAERRGGNIHGIKQMELRGGNAANTAAGLASLGAKVYPIITTDTFGFHLLKFYLRALGADLSYIKDDGEVGLTTAIEITHEKERVNIMMGDLGSLPDFGPKNLAERDFKLLREADYVAVFNWAATRKWGTELAQIVFRYVKEKGKAKTYFDSGDPTPNKENIPRLLRNVLQARLSDVLSVNENEAFQYASHLDKRVRRLRRKLDHHEMAKECARILSKNLTIRVDLHTTAFSGSFVKDNEVMVPAFPVKGLRSTGAGDSWNAGNIYGDVLKLPDSCRLTLANAVAAYYVSSPKAEHPTLPKLIEFCQERT